MQKRLTQEQQDRIVEVAIREFGRCGFHAANINAIASGAGVSVGVIYKYYADKRALFDACLTQAMDFLDEALGLVLNDVYLTSEEEMVGNTERMIRACLALGQKERDKLRLYYLVTANRAQLDDVELARKMETSTARVYHNMMRKVQEMGIIRKDLDARFAALFTDTLLKMVLYLHSSDYYSARYGIYCGEDDGHRDEELVQQLARFIRGAFRPTSEETDA